MINWDDYKYNQKFSLSIEDGERTDEVQVQLIEYGWHEHGRIKITAKLQVMSSDKPVVWHKDAIIELPIKTEGVISFIVLEHTSNIPRYKTIHKGEIKKMTVLE
jgi:hypothetical protein